LKTYPCNIKIGTEKIFKTIWGRKGYLNENTTSSMVGRRGERKILVKGLKFDGGRMGLGIVSRNNS